MAHDPDDKNEASRRLNESPAQASARARSRVSAARLVSRLYTSAHPSLRAKLLDNLVRPLSPLGLVAVAAGAFAHLLPGGRVAEAVDDAMRYSAEQVFELASFAEQVSPEALRECALALAANPLGWTAFSAAATMLLLRLLHSDPLR